MATDTAPATADPDPSQPGLVTTDDPALAGPVQDRPVRVLGTTSTLLYQALAGVHDALGFDVIANAVFKDPMITRIVEPTSLLDTALVLADPGRRPASYAMM